MMMREFPVSKLFELEKSFRQKRKSPLHYGFLGGEPDMLNVCHEDGKTE